MPRVLDFDSFYEHLGLKRHVNISDAEAYSNAAKSIRKEARQLTRSQLTLYMKGMMPLIVDSTAISQLDLAERMLMLRKYGYDIGMIYLQEDLDVKLARAASRKRGVDPDIIIKGHEKEKYRIEELCDFMEDRGHEFYVNNPKSRNYDHIFIEFANDFFHKPLKNKEGIKKIKYLHDNNLKYADAEMDDTEFWYQF